MKLLKIIGVLLLVVVLLLGGAVLYVSQVFDPNDYKPELVNLVRDHTGRELTIDGDLELTLFPWLGVRVGAASLSNPEGFEGPFAGIDTVDVRIKLVPLLTRQIEVGQIELKGLRLGLERNAEGRNNWDDLVAADEKADAESTPPESAESSDGPAIAGFRVGGVTIEDAALGWDDELNNQHFSVSELQVATGSLEPGSPVDLNASFQLQSSEPEVKGTVTLEGIVSAEAGGQRLSLAETVLKTDLAGTGLPADQVKAALALAAELDLAAQRYTLNGVRLDLGLSGKGMPGNGMQAMLGFDAVADLAEDTAAITKLVASAAGLDLSGDLKVQALSSDPSFKGLLKLAAFSPRGVMSDLGLEPPQTADSEVLKTAALTTALAGGANSIELRNLKLTLDDSSLTGSASVRDFSAPAIGFDLVVDRMDLDRYLPPPPAEGSEPATAGKGAEGELPLEALRKLKVAGKLKVGELKVSGLRATDAELDVNADGGLINLEPLGLKLYQGSSQGAAKLDVRGDQPKFAARNTLQRIQIEPLLNDLMGESMIKGTGTVVANINGVGLQPEGIKKTLNGKVNLQFKDGAVKGINVAQVIRKARATHSGGSAPTDEPNETDFAELTGTANIKNGLVSNNDLSLKSPLLRVSGEGTADLPSEQLDYLVNASIVESSRGQGGQDLADLRGVTIPVRISGSFADPSISPDLTAVLEERAKEEVQKHLDKEKGKVQEKLGDELGNRLKGLIK
jgi:AsmA protein